MKKKFEKELIRAVPFTLDRMKKEGGFGATPKLPATLEDTYHALRILDKIEQYCGLSNRTHIDSGPHAEFLERFLKKEPNLSLKGAYRLFWCMKRCGLFHQARRLAKEIIPASLKERPEELYYAMRISRLLNISSPISHSKSTVSRTVSFRGILFRRWMAIYIDMSTKAGVIDKAAATDWIKRCQNYDGGFGFLPGSTSYLENSHFALRALDCLNEGPANTENAERFVLACQTRGGGFSRKADAAPFLDATWHGVAALWHLAKDLT